MSKFIQRGRAGPQISIACWLNLLCLDAPLVALCWQWLFARTFRVELGGGSRAALFLTAWLIYLADRLGDIHSLGQGVPLSLRQQFCRTHRLAWSYALVVVGAADLLVIDRWVDRNVIFPGIICGVAASIYLALNARGKLWRALPLKETTVGVLFSLGTVLVPLVSVEKVTGLFQWSCILFASVCALNCISIADWERELDVAQQKLSIATIRESVAGFAPMVSAALALVSALSGVSVNSARWLFAALSASALLLAALARFGGGLNRDVRTSLADLALLTPLVPALVS